MNGHSLLLSERGPSSSFFFKKRVVVYNVCMEWRVVCHMLIPDQAGNEDEWGFIPESFSVFL